MRAASKKTQLPARHGNFIYGSLGLVLLSGVIWLISNFLIEGHEGWGELALNSQFWALKVHGVGMVLFLVALGYSFESIGRAFLILFGLLAFSGWLIYYGPSGDARDWISIVHWGFGLVVACTVTVVYVITGKEKGKGKRRR